MSAASRERERVRAQALLEKRYGPFPDPGIAPPPIEQQDPELARLMGWFCGQHRDICAEFSAVDIVVADDGSGEIFVSPRSVAARADRPSMALAAMLALASYNVVPVEQPKTARDIA